MIMQKTRSLAALFLLALSYGCTTFSPSPELRPSPPKSNTPPLGQLPSLATPTHYKVGLTILPGQERFTGSVDISITLHETTDHIWLHGKNLLVSQTKATLEDGTQLTANFEQMHTSGVAKVSFGDSISPQSLVLSMEYSAPFDEDLEGLYQVKADGQWYAFTQLEPISGRLVFPGFDEPRFKTPFDISLTINNAHRASAPYPAIRTESLKNNQTKITYQTTAPLPVYLLAFAVGPFEFVEHAPLPPNAIRTKPLPFRGLAVAGKGKLLNYAMERTGRLLELLELYFGIPYPYEKLDIVAVPEFSAGAMENVGVITFRDWLLLLDEKNAPTRQKRAFTYVMTHELAHQWFGNLVTMPWWDDLWLNEAFASWMESKIIEEYDPSYKAHLATIQTSLWAMKEDSRMSARQIRQPIENDHDIHNAFDGITYSKGEGVLGMLERFVGEAAFQKSIHHHLSRFSHGNATFSDLLISIEETTGRDVSSAFNSFILKPGVPFLNISTTCSDAQTTALHITQARYLPAGSKGSASGTWEIPFCLRYQIQGEEHQHCTLLQSVPRQTISLPHTGCPQWLHPNADGAGYYRWNLSQEGWSRLTKNINQLHPTELLSLVDSMEAASLAGQGKATAIFELAPALSTMSDREIATTPMEMLRYAHRNLVDNTMEQELATFGQKLYQRQLQTLGFGDNSSDPTDDDSKLYRRELLTFLAFVAEDLGVRKKLGTWGKNYLNAKGTHNVSPDLLGLALQIAVQDSSITQLNRAAEALRNASDPATRSQLISGIAAANTPEKSEIVRKLLLSDDLRNNERLRVLRSHSSRKENTLTMWAWVQEHYEDLISKIPGGHLGSLPKSVRGLCTKASAEELHKFFEPHVQEFPGGPRNLRSAVEAIELCADRKLLQQDAVQAFFSRPL